MHIIFFFFLFRSSFGFFVVFLFGIVICVVFGGVIDMFWVDDLILLILFVFYFPYLNVFFFLQFFRNISWIDLNFHADTSGLAVEHWHFDTSIWILTLPYLQLNLNIKTPLLYVSQCKWKNGPSPFGQRWSCRRPAHYFFKFIQHTHQRHIRMQTDTHTHTEAHTLP